MSMKRMKLLALIAALVAGLSSGTAVADQREIAAMSQPAVKSPTAIASAMLAAARAGNRLVLGGERGVVLLSDDHGRSWRQADTPVRVSLTALQFIDEKQGWALGHMGVILHTKDGGQTWQRQMDGLNLVALFKSAADAAQDPQVSKAAKEYAQLLQDDGPDKPWLGLHFRDAAHGIVVGAYNLAMTTSDGGATWQPLSFRLPNPKALHLYGVQVQDRTVMIHGEQGLLLRSEDDGATFAPVSSPYKGTWFGLLPRSSNEWIAYGLRGSIYRTTDGGGRWEVLPTGLSSSITAGRRLADGALMMVAQTGEVMISRGETLAFDRRAVSVAAAVSDAIETGDGALVVATLRGPYRVSLSPAVR